MMREGRVASLGLLSAMPRSSGVTFAESETTIAFRAWRVMYPDGQVVYSRNDRLYLRHKQRGHIWIDLVSSPEIFAR